MARLIDYFGLWHFRGCFIEKDNFVECVGYDPTQYIQIILEQTLTV